MPRYSVLEALEALESADERPILVEAAPVADPDLFRVVSPPRHNFAPGLVLSVMFHCACIFGLPPLMELIPDPGVEAMMRMRVTEMRPLRIYIPERLFLPPAEATPPKLAEPQPQPRPTPRPRETVELKVQAELTVPPKPERVPPRQFSLPEKIRRADSDQTLIQPRLPPELPLTSQVRLPQLILLSAPVLPRPAPRRFVEPGKSSAPSVAPKIDAPPQLAPAGNLNPELRIPNMLAGAETALLRLPRPTTPVRQFQAPAPLPTGRGASVSPTLGEPIDLLALSNNPASLAERVTIPLGNQIGRLPELPAYTDGVSTGSASGKGSADAGGASSTGKLDTANAEMAALAKALASLPAHYSVPIRIEHPVSAAFDIVVTQSAADQAFPESANALSGQPVYTVYLQVGAPRAWILQYCVPKEVAAAPVMVAGAISISSPPPSVKAPFPLVTVLPPAAMLPRTGYIILQGFVDTAGRLRDLAVMRAPNPSIKDLIMPDLVKWQFRPAVRNGAPIAVEIVLAIPPQQV